MTRELPSPEFLRKILRYEPDTGRLFWRCRTPDTFVVSPTRPAKDVCTNWNARWANKEAFTSVDGPGYRKGLINGRLYKAAHVVWAMTFDVWPQHVGKWLDHVNRCRTDNRIENLRLVSPAQNSWNRTSSPGESPVIGVSWDADKASWRSRITVHGRRFSLGRFSSFQDAVAARKQAEEVYRCGWC